MWSHATLSFPPPLAVTMAGALLPQLHTEVFRRGGSARQYSVTVSPGVVRVRDLRLVDDRRPSEVRTYSQPLLEQLDRQCQEAAEEFWRGNYAARRARWRFAQARAAGGVPRAGAITYWSAKSRMRMVTTLASLDWTPVVDGDAGTRPAMVTLTLPGDWETVAPTGAAFKRIMERFWSRWDRSRWGRFVGVWKLEFQRRGAPHVHIYCAVPTDPAFRDWLSRTWYEVVGSGDERHLRAGTGIDWGEGIRASDPKRLAVYFAGRSIGHNIGKDKEYQHRVPDLWAAEGCGRFWGYKRMERCEVEVEVERHQFVALKRLMRRTVKARGLNVPRSMRGNRGATLLANDGPAWLEQASRHRPVGDASNVCLEWRYVRSVGMVNLTTGEVTGRTSPMRLDG